MGSAQPRPYLTPDKTFHNAHKSTPCGNTVWKYKNQDLEYTIYTCTNLL